MRDQVYIEQTADEMDQLQAATTRELTVQNLDRFARLRREIEAALRRLDNGNYGACLSCGENIEAKRLRAVPWATYCIKCQEIADRNGLADHERYTGGAFMNAA